MSDEEFRSLLNTAGFQNHILEFSDDNDLNLLKFWQDVEKFRDMDSSLVGVWDVESLYKTYLATDAKRKVLSGAVYVSANKCQKKKG